MPRHTSCDNAGFVFGVGLARLASGGGCSIRGQTSQSTVSADKAGEHRVDSAWHEYVVGTDCCFRLQCRRGRIQ